MDAKRKSSGLRTDIEERLVISGADFFVHAKAGLLGSRT